MYRLRKNKSSETKTDRAFQGDGIRVFPEKDLKSQPICPQEALEQILEENKKLKSENEKLKKEIHEYQKAPSQLAPRSQLAPSQLAL